MNERVAASLLWGVVGGLAFLVLAQGYRLVVGPGVGFLPLLGVALVVVAVSAGTTYAVGEIAAKRRV